MKEDYQQDGETSDAIESCDVLKEFARFSLSRLPDHFQTIACTKCSEVVDTLALRTR